MNDKQKINDWFSSFEHRFESAVPNIIAETATEYFKERFTKQEWDGVPWRPLNANYAKRKTRGRGRILTRTGALMNSIRPAEIKPEKVVISAGNSRVPYARAHNEGMSIKGVQSIKGYTNTNFMGTGKKVKIKPHKRTVNFRMPQRQFMGRSKYLNERLITRLTKAFNK